MANHYITINSENMIVRGFSDEFETPSDADICINESGGRHFEMLGVINPPLFDENLCHLYRYSSELEEKVRASTEEETQNELDSMDVTEADDSLSSKRLRSDIDYLSLIVGGQL